MAFLEPEFGPRPPLGDTRVDGLTDDGRADAPGSFHLFACIVEGVAYGSFGAVFVCGYRRGGESGGVIEFFVVGPVWTAKDDVSDWYYS